MLKMKNIILKPKIKDLEAESRVIKDGVNSGQKFIEAILIHNNKLLQHQYITPTPTSNNSNNICKTNKVYANRRQENAGHPNVSHDARSSPTSHNSNVKNR